MLKAFWQQLPHTYVPLLGFVLILLGLLFPDDATTDQRTWLATARRQEDRMIMAFVVAMLLMRVAYVFHYRIDSDEPQHLHVVWGWTQGLLPYRDVFDNHTPLFHLLYAPLLAALGERADILYFMRLAMPPLYGVTLWGTYRLGRALFSPRLGRWAAVLTGLFPGFFFCSVEFRTDILWTALWVVAFAVLVDKRMTRQRSFLAGLLLGAALSVSLKTLLLLGVISGASIGAVYVSKPSGSRFPLHAVSQYALAAAGGLVLIPLLLIVFFVAQGAWEPLWYDTIQHNVLPGLGHWRRPYLLPLFPFLVFLVWRGAQVVVQNAPDASTGLRRVFVFLATAGYITALFCLWPLWPREDYLPFYPPFIVLVTPVVFRAADRLGGRRPSVRPSDSPFVYMVALGVIEIVLVLFGGPLWRDQTQAENLLLADVLRLTGPEDSVVDVKGETVFRPRASYYVLEGITRTRIKQGSLPDDIPDRLVAAHTCVALGDDYRFPTITRAFLQANYLPVGPLRVAGRWLDPPPQDNPSVPFTIAIP